MSTIYTDGAGNKYLGDCRWGNHDINYPTTNYLLSIGDTATSTDWWSDMASLMPTVGYASYYLKGDWTYANGAFFYYIVPTGRSLGIGRRVQNTTFSWSSGRTTDLLLTGGISTGLGSEPRDYCVTCSPNSFSALFFRYNSTHNGWLYRPIFEYYGQVVDINTNYNYYTASDINQYVMLSEDDNSSITVPPSLDTAAHYIAGATKSLLQSGRAAYSISCSDGQTPTSQWATDMWVYDNNATLGYPVIGRVPNMLLGTGTYTYLKPVKINGSVFPDGGSPWYLPVGTFSGKTLLMRCYSSLP